MERKILLGALVLGLISIALGAFGAHGLKEQLAADSLESYKTGVHYQMIHALFLGLLSATNLISKKAKNTMMVFLSTGSIRKPRNLNYNAVRSAEVCSPVPYLQILTIKTPRLKSQKAIFRIMY